MQIGIVLQSTDIQKALLEEKHIRLHLNSKRQRYFESCFSAKLAQCRLDLSNDEAKTVIVLESAKCVFKLFCVDSFAYEQIINAVQHENDASRIHQSCLVELLLLYRIRKLLQLKATPCLSFVYSYFFVQNERKQVRLAICVDYLSKITLEQWLVHHIMNHRKFIRFRTGQLERDALVSALRQQLEVLLLHLFVALHCLSLLNNVVHNDLHLKNIMMVHFKDESSNIVYVVKDKYYVVRNNLGDALCQIPVICDFEMASNNVFVNSESFREHFQHTQRCAHHFGKKPCRQRVFCDVLRLLNSVYDLLCSAPSSDLSILLEAFCKFNRLREKLNFHQTNRCANDLISIAQLIEEMFCGVALPVATNLTSQATIFNCNIFV